MNESGPNLRKLAKNRRFEDLEAACLEGIEAGVVDRDDLLSALNLTAHRADPETAESLSWLAVCSWGERYGPAEGLLLAKAVAGFLPSSELLREEIAGLYVETRADHPAVGTVLDRTVRRRDLDLPSAVERADALLRLPPGTCFVLKGRKTAGRITGISEDGRSLVVEMEGEIRALPFARSVDLVPLAEDDFLALAAFDRERAAALADEDPARLVEMLLRAHGPVLNYRGIRTHLVDLVPRPWTEWWNEARPNIRRSPWIKVGEGRQPVLELRRAPLSHEVVLREELDGAEGGAERIRLILSYLDEAGDHLRAEGDLLGDFAAALSRQAGEGDAALALASLAALAELHDAAPEAVPAPPDPEWPEDADVTDLMYPIEDPRLQRSVLAFVRNHRPESWPGFFAGAMPACSHDVCEGAAREIEKAGRGELLLAVSRQVMEKASRFPEALVWLFKTAGAGNLPVSEGGPDRARLLIEMVGAIDRSSREPGGRALFTTLRNALSTKNYAIVRDLLSEIDDPAARHVKEAVERCIGLPDLTRARLVDVLVETHHHLFVEELPPWEREDVIYTTREGLEKRRAEYEDLVNVRLPEVADAIGVAAAEGDLSENAEYTAGLETRQRLTDLANAMRAELTLAKVIEPEMADTDIATVGSRVRARNTETGEERTFVFLGPFDVDMERGVYSYRAPVSMAFMGKKEGEVTAARLAHGDQHWEILEVSNGLR